MYIETNKKSMKRIIIIGSLVSCALLALTGEVQAQSGIEQVLKNIEANNKELQANAQLITSQKLEAKTDNNLPDPTLSYAHLWGAKDKNETIGELVVSQSFDFPSLYATRNKLNRLKAGAFDSQADVFRQEKLLLAKEVCLDIIMLRQQKHILEERLRNAEELAKMYAKRLQTGDANALETNKINLELLNVKTETSLNETALRNKLQELNTLNGNIPVVFEENTYPATPFPADYQILKSEVLSADRTLMAFNNESLVARKQIAVNKSQWLPKLELGYRRNTETGTPFILLPAFRESQQGENSQSASAEHRLAERQRHPASGIRTGTALSGSQNAAHLYGGIQENFSGATRPCTTETGSDRRTDQHDRVFCRGIRHLSKSSELPPAGESISEGNGTNL